MSTNQIRVKCDAPGCGWAEIIEIGDSAKYLNAPCHKCGTAPIINEKEMELLVVVAGLASVGMCTMHTPTAPGDPVPEGAIRIDSAAWKNGGDKP